MDGNDVIDALKALSRDMKLVLKCNGMEIVSIEIDLKKPTTDPDELHVNLMTTQTR